MDRLKEFFAFAYFDGPPDITEAKLIKEEYTNSRLNALMLDSQIDPTSAAAFGFQLGIKYAKFLKTSSTKVEDSTTLKGEVK